MLKKSELALLLALVFTISLSCLDFSNQCNNIRGKVFRLHILANSDSDYDQQLKLKVRDRLLVEGLCVFNGSQNLSDTLVIANDNLKKFKETAKDELAKNGCNLDVSAKVENCFFNTRTYGSTTLPAGVYKALRIKIGKANGHNWWCVMYPSLCLPSCEQKASDVLNESETDIVENENKYIVKFKIVEFFEEFKDYFS